jgi:O-antigen ligase
MPKLVNRARKSNVSRIDFPGATALAIIPVFSIFYVLVILEFIPNDGTRWENILFWPLVAALILAHVCRNWARIDRKFFLSLPIMSLIVYLVFAAASVTWAYAPGLSFTRLVLQVLACIVIVVPFALPISARYLIPSVHVCYAIAFAVSAYYVLTTPPSPIGHPGYFTHKQELGLLAATGMILACHEVLHRGWRRMLGAFVICTGFWLVVESQSKSALAYSIVALAGSWLILLLCKKTRLTPAFFVIAIVVAFMFVSNPIERIGYRLYGDSSLTGRTEIWAFINYQISLKPWLGWGFHSYYFVPNSPILQAGGFVAQMPSSHSGFLELKLETGRIGYWIFLVFIYSSLHVLERVRRKAPVRAWCYLSIELFAILINLTDSHWLVLDPISIIYIFVVAESIRYPSKPPQTGRVAARHARNRIASRPLRTVQGVSYGNARS